jgi:hypothetical protein
MMAIRMKEAVNRRASSQKGEKLTRASFIATNPTPQNNAMRTRAPSAISTL